MILAHKHHVHFQSKQLSSHKHFNEEVSHNCAGCQEKNALLSSIDPGLSHMMG